MGLFSCVALIAGACIGSAIFSISGMTIWYAGPAAVVSWLVAALIFGAYGLLVAELAGRYPRSGGVYIFPKRAIGGGKGSFWGFVSGWGYIISNIIAIAFSAIYVGAYLHAGFPSVGTGAAIPAAACLLAAAIILPGGGVSQNVQNVLVGVLVATMLVFCSTAFAGGGFDAARFDAFFTTGVKGAGGFVSAIPLAMLAYGGCLTVSFMVSEVSDPKRNVPRSLFLGLGIVAILYAMVIVAIVGTLPFSVLNDNEALRYIPLFAAISDGGLQGCPWLSKVVSVSGAAALLTTIIVLLRINARTIQAMSFEGLLPGFLGKQNSRGVAWAAVLPMAAVCIVLCFCSRWTERLIVLGAVLNIATMAVTCVSSVLCRRSKGAGIMFPIVTIAVLMACYVPEIVRGKADMWVFTAAVYAAGVALYLLCSRRSNPRLCGIVVHGKGHGHLHGIPTANLEPFKGETLPVAGVWKTKVIIDGKEYGGLTNVGLRPSDDDSPQTTVETLVMDFAGDLYGREMVLEFERYIRETRHFANLDELRTQIERDIAASA